MSLKLKKITFVCTGNTCRSVMAEKTFEKLVKNTPIKDIEVDSAGTDTLSHYAIVGDLKDVMDENRIDYTGHLPKRIDRAIMEDSSLVLVMTRSHKEEVYWRFSQFKDKIFLLSEYAGEKGEDIADPIGMGKDAYRRVFAEIEGYLKKLVEKLSDEFKKEG